MSLAYTVSGIRGTGSHKIIVPGLSLYLASERNQSTRIIRHRYLASEWLCYGDKLMGQL